MSKVSTIGLDLAKQVFQLQGNDSRGHKCFSRRLQREELLPFLARQPAALVAMEACGGAHYWARQIKALGHEVKLLHPRHVKPFVQVHKNDARDAAAIAEAAVRPAIPAVACKAEVQLDLQMLHRVRDRLVRERVAIGNELRAVLAEQGIVISRGHAAVRHQVPLILEDGENGLSPLCRRLVADLREQWLEREERIKAYDRDVERLAKELPVCKELQTVPGIGPIIATLLHAYAGDAKHYASGRHFAASLGLVPRQHATGGRERLLGISKQGNKHLRRQLVHGARAAYRQLAGRTDSRLARWIAGLGDKHVNKVVVALANKLARIAWVIMARGVSYQP